MDPEREFLRLSTSGRFPRLFAWAETSPSLSPLVDRHRLVHHLERPLLLRRLYGRRTGKQIFFFQLSS